VLLLWLKLLLVSVELSRRRRRGSHAADAIIKVTMNTASCSIALLKGIRSLHSAKRRNNTAAGGSRISFSAACSSCAVVLLLLCFFSQSDIASPLALVLA